MDSEEDLAQPNANEISQPRTFWGFGYASGGQESENRFMRMAWSALLVDDAVVTEDPATWKWFAAGGGGIDGRQTVNRCELWALLWVAK